MLYMLRLTFFVFLFAGLSLAQADEVSLEQKVQAVMEKARAEGKQMTLPVNKHAEAGQKAAKEAAARFYSPEFQEKLSCEQQRLKTEVFQEHVIPWENKKEAMKREREARAGNLGESEKVYLFFSSSVPVATMHTYLSTIASIGDPNVIPVMRGLVQDKSNRVRYFSQVLQEDLSCRDSQQPCKRYEVAIKLKPSLFGKYDITRVPAVVYAKGEKAFLVQGDAGLDYLLERINREAKSAGLEGLINTMRRSEQ